MKRLLAIFITLACITGMVSCKNCEKTAVKEPQSTLRDEGYLKGVVKDNTGLDGCSFLIELEDTNPDDDSPGITLNPIEGFSEEFHKDGLEVWVKFKKSGAMTTCMKGQTAIIESVKTK